MAFYILFHFACSNQNWAMVYIYFFIYFYSINCFCTNMTLFGFVCSPQIKWSRETRSLQFYIHYSLPFCDIYPFEFMIVSRIVSGKNSLNRRHFAQFLLFHRLFLTKKRRTRKISKFIFTIAMFILCLFI
jgi:hypothetical protein